MKPRIYLLSCYLISQPDSFGRPIKTQISPDVKDELPEAFPLRRTQGVIPTEYSGTYFQVMFNENRINQM